MYFPDGDQPSGQKDDGADWFRWSFTTEFTMSSFPKSLISPCDPPPSFSDVDAIDAESSDSQQQLSIASPAAVTPPPYFENGFPPLFDNRPVVLRPRSTMPKGDSFTK
jgi:hypothetical protein